MGKYICISTTLVAVGVICIAAGTLLMFYFDQLIKKGISESVVLKEDNEAFKMWKESNIYIGFYFFNVTNAEDVTLRNVKPEVKEVGPYVYREAKIKVALQFGSNNNTIAYREQKYYIFDSPSIFNEEDSIVNLNLATVVISKIIDNKIPWAAFFIKHLFQSEKLFERRTVKELIWGYNATLAIQINDILKKLHIPAISFPEFGLYAGKRSNGSMGSLFNISTGLADINNLGKIYSRNEDDQLPFWSGKSCNVINGTDGTFWPPFVKQSNQLYLYSDDTCRSIYLLYDSREILHGIPVYKFIAPPSAFHDYSKITEYQCFCVPDVKSCLKGGVLDVSACKDGAPVILSLPHFLHADAEYIDAIGGMQPSPLKHETFIDVEPLTGKALKAHKRLQINLLLKHYDSFPATRNFSKHMIFPLAWADEYGMLTPEDGKKLNDNLFKKIFMTQLIQYSLIALGCTCILLFIAFILWKCPKCNETAQGQRLPTTTVVDDDKLLNS